MTRCLLDTSFIVAYFNEVADRRSGPARAYRAGTLARAKLFVSLAMRGFNPWK